MGGELFFLSLLAIPVGVGAVAGAIGTTVVLSPFIAESVTVNGYKKMKIRQALESELPSKQQRKNIKEIKISDLMFKSKYPKLGRDIEICSNNKICRGPNARLCKALLEGAIKYATDNPYEVVRYYYDIRRFFRSVLDSTRVLQAINKYYNSRSSEELYNDAKKGGIEFGIRYGAPTNVKNLQRSLYKKYRRGEEKSRSANHN